MPRGLDCLEGHNNPCVRCWGKEGRVSGGVCDQRTYEEDGPGPWEALASPRRIPVVRRAGDPSPTHTRMRAHASSACAAQNTRPHRGRPPQGAPEPWRMGAGSRRAAQELRRRGTGGARTRSSKGGPCRGELAGGHHGQCLDIGGQVTGTSAGSGARATGPGGTVPLARPSIEVPALARASHRQRADAAVGVEGVTQEAAGQNLAANLQDLHARLKAKRYRHPPLRRVYIPKAQGKTRPRGISACEDTLVQDAVREGLDAMYAQDCWDGSQGFRPERKAHDAVRTLQRLVERGEGEGSSRRTSCPFRQRGSHRVEEEAGRSGSRGVAQAAHWEVRARGGTRRQSVVQAGGGSGPGRRALSVGGERLSALRARPVV